MRKTACLILCIITVFNFSSCKDNSPEFFLNSLLTLDLQDGNVSACEKEIKGFLNGFEQKISVNIKTSEVSLFNAAPKDTEIKLSADVYNVLEKALNFYYSSWEAFNPCMYDLSLLWGFSPEGEFPRVLPSKDEIESLLTLATPESIVLTAGGAYKKEDGVKIDLGAIAKGYAAEKCKDIAVKHNVTSGIINIAGNIYAIGGNKEKSRPFNIAVTDPRAIENNSNYFGYLSVENTSVSVSGDYERFFMLNGKRYCHIIDPKTGTPVDNGIISVAAIGANGADTDAATTAAMALGLNGASAFFEEKGISAIIIMNDKTYYVCGDVSLSGVENYTLKQYAK